MVRSASPPPHSPPLPMAFCSKGDAKGKLTTMAVGVGWRQAPSLEFLEMKFLYRELHAVPTAFVLRNAGHSGKGHREPRGMLSKEGDCGDCGEFLGSGGSSKDVLLQLSLAAGKTPSLDTRVPELGCEL